MQLNGLLEDLHQDWGQLSRFRTVKRLGHIFLLVNHDKLPQLHWIFRWHKRSMIAHPNSGSVRRADQRDYQEYSNCASNCKRRSVCYRCPSVNLCTYRCHKAMLPLTSVAEVLVVVSNNSGQTSYPTVSIRSHIIVHICHQIYCNNTNVDATAACQKKMQIGYLVNASILTSQ